MIQNRSDLKPDKSYYAAFCYIGEHEVIDIAEFFNQNVKIKRTICFDMIQYRLHHFIIGNPVYFESIDEVRFLVEKLDREIYEIELWLRDGGLPSNEVASRLFLEV